MLFVGNLIFVFNIQALPITTLKDTHTDAAVDGRRSPLLVQKFSKISGDVLVRATKVRWNKAWTLGVLTHLSFFLTRLLMNSTRRPIVVVGLYRLEGEKRHQIG